MMVYINCVILTLVVVLVIWGAIDCIRIEIHYVVYKSCRFGVDCHWWLLCCVVCIRRVVLKRVVLCVQVMSFRHGL